MLIREDEKIKLFDNLANPTYLSSLSDDELYELYKHADDLRSFCSRMESVAKELCNSVYGGFGSASLRYFNQSVASDITAEGRWSCKLTEKVSEKYFRDVWPKDVKWHDELREKFPELMANVTEIKPVFDDVTVYCDTDSWASGSIIHTKKYGKITTDDLFNLGTHVYTEKNGTEHAKIDTHVLNWSKTKGLHFAAPRTIIRHKTSKKKWRLRTKSGKEIVVTNDHSLIVFRDGKKISTTADSVLPTDKILVVHETTSK